MKLHGECSWFILKMIYLLRGIWHTLSLIRNKLPTTKLNIRFWYQPYCNRYHRKEACKHSCHRHNLGLSSGIHSMVASQNGKCLQPLFMIEDISPFYSLQYICSSRKRYWINTHNQRTWPSTFHKPQWKTECSVLNHNHLQKLSLPY